MSAIFKQYFKASLVLVTLLSYLPSTILSYNQSHSLNWTTCEAPGYSSCRCTSHVFTNVIARCHFDHVTDLKKIVHFPQNILRLNLHGNNMKEVPRHSFKNYTNLIYLSLSSNIINFISQGAFCGLTRLKELNLQDNIIKQWDTTLIEQDLPNLIMLNVAQNIYWKPDQQVLSLPNLKIIHLFIIVKKTYSKSFGCYLVRDFPSERSANESHQMFTESLPPNIKDKVMPEALLISRDKCLQPFMFFTDETYWDVLDSNGFYFHCSKLKENRSVLNPPNLNTRQAQQPNAWYYIRKFEKQYCWKAMKKIHVVTFLAGILAVIFNLIVIITSLRSRVLRESVAHVLVANIAVADLLISLYMIIITSTRQSMSAENYYSMHLPYFCKIVGTVFLIGQFSSPMMSFVMTLERYLAVVYCMRPHIRITRRMTYVAMAIVWGLSISVAVSFMTSPDMSAKATTMCMPLASIDDIQYLYVAGGFGVALFVAAIALYGHMYLDFQKTNQKTVQLQRENRLARRIALIMFTNFLFFIMPLILIATISNIKSISRINRNIFTKTFGIVFLAINSCLNPLLFAFRNQGFRNEFRRNCFNCRRAVAPDSVPSPVGSIATAFVSTNYVEKIT